MTSFFEKVYRLMTSWLQ